MFVFCVNLPRARRTAATRSCNDESGSSEASPPAAKYPAKSGLSDASKRPRVSAAVTQAACPVTHESCCASLTDTRHSSTNIFSRTFNQRVMQNPRPVQERMDSQVRGRRIRPAAAAVFYWLLQKQKRKHKDEGDCKDRRRVPVGGGGT